MEPGNPVGPTRLLVLHLCSMGGFCIARNLHLFLINSSPSPGWGCLLLNCNMVKSIIASTDDLLSDGIPYNTPESVPYVAYKFFSISFASIMIHLRKDGRVMSRPLPLISLLRHSWVLHPRSQEKLLDASMLCHLPLSQDSPARLAQGVLWLSP